MANHPKQQIAAILLCICLTSYIAPALAKRRPPAGGRLAIVVDERLSALRTQPDFLAPLIRRLGRGSLIAVKTEKRSRDGIIFYNARINSRTNGWIQRDAVVSPTRTGDDERLLRLIQGSESFDRIARARIFLNYFRASRLRPEVLMIYSQAAEEAASRLSREAERRLDQDEMTGGGAPQFSYFLNFNGLDRYNRQGITFTFDARERRFRYDGEGWQEILHRYPQSAAAIEARKHLAQNHPRQGVGVSDDFVRTTPVRGWPVATTCQNHPVRGRP